MGKVCGKREEDIRGTNWGLILTQRRKDAKDAEGMISE